ncbi:MAG TPA: SAM-dependent methyltransferase [Chitinophagaceae bacterium]|nr:SAM-dependent methyltransferase [Chitinophagaceae bacterium]
MQITLSPIAFVKNTRTEPTDDFWGSIISEIELAENIPTEAFNSIEGFSHLEIIFYFDKANPADLVFAGHPRGNKSYPYTGIFAQRKKDRPNSIGLCTAQLVEHKGRIITVLNLDAIDGTPVLDIKPVMREFEPKGDITQPAWVSDLMKEYWR